MVLMCISCGWVPDQSGGERDLVEYSVPNGAGRRALCTDCLAAVNDAWVAKSLPALGPSKP